MGILFVLRQGKGCLGFGWSVFSTFRPWSWKGVIINAGVGPTWPSSSALLCWSVITRIGRNKRFLNPFLPFFLTLIICLFFFNTAHHHLPKLKERQQHEKRLHFLKPRFSINVKNEFGRLAKSWDLQVTNFCSTLLFNVMDRSKNGSEVNFDNRKMDQGGRNVGWWNNRIFCLDLKPL